MRCEGVKFIDFSGSGGADEFDAVSTSAPTGLRGGADNDILLGGSGDDRLGGDLGTDRADGGNGISSCLAGSETACEI